MAESPSTPLSGGDLFNLLRDMEARALEHASALPEQPTLEASWVGVLFAVGSRPLVTDLSNVREILNYPPAISSVPGTKHWVRGIANIRGNLLPIIDLQAFLFGRATVPGRRNRVLVVECEDFLSGLLVDQLVGIRHFRPSDQTTQPKGVPDVLRLYVESAFVQGEEQWPVFDVGRLVASQEFKSAAI